MYHQFLKLKKIYILPTQCIYTFVYRNRDFHAMQHSISLYNRNRKCLLPATNWVLKLITFRFESAQTHCLPEQSKILCRLSAIFHN